MKFNRIYINSRLAKNSKIELDREHTHYIKTVLRLKVNDKFRVFNSVDGEFLAQITKLDRNNLIIDIQEQLKKPSSDGYSLTLVISIIKQDKLMLALNMATQLGVTEIIPLITDRCQFRSVNIERLIKCIIEATEQSERLNPPIVRQAVYILDYLKENDNLILYANEYEKEGNSILHVISSLDSKKQPAIFSQKQVHKEKFEKGMEVLATDSKDIHENKALEFTEKLPLEVGVLRNSNISIIIGPEGGFTKAEIASIASHKNAYSISLGKNILRAETAVVTAIAQVKLLIS